MLETVAVATPIDAIISNHLSGISIGTLNSCLERYIGLGLRYGGDNGSEGGELGFWILEWVRVMVRVLGFGGQGKDHGLLRLITESEPILGTLKMLLTFFQNLIPEPSP